MRTRLSLFLAFVLTLLTPYFASANLVRSSSMQKALKPCLNSQELDCIESFQVIYANGKNSLINLVQPAEGQFQDDFGQIIENSGSVWSYLDSTGTARKIVVTTTLNGENYKSPVYKRLYPAMWFSILDIAKSEVDSGIRFKIVLRMSWLQPQGVGLIAKNAAFSENIKDNVRHFTFIGSPFLGTSLNSPEKYAELNSPTQDNTQSDGENTVLYFVVDHLSSIPGGTFWEPSCAQFGYSVTSHNAIGAGQPYMSDAETLKFNIGAPHKLSTGELNEGFFTTDIPIDYLNCKWPNNLLTKSPRVEVSVIDTNGAKQIATTSVQIEKGILKVRAFGFHYSSPTITLKASNDLTLPSLDIGSVSKVQVINKPRTIICIKGKIIRQIIGVNAKCPNGFKSK